MMSICASWLALLICTGNVPLRTQLIDEAVMIKSGIRNLQVVSQSVMMVIVRHIPIILRSFTFMIIIDDAGVMIHHKVDQLLQVLGDDYNDYDDDFADDGDDDNDIDPP